MFSNFFGYVIDPERGVRLFTWHHYMLIGLAIIAVFLPLKYAHVIYKSKHETKIRNIVFGWLVTLEIIYHAHNWLNGELSFPLHICSFAVFMSLALLKTNSQRIFEFVFFFGVLGGFMALLVPFSYGFPYYNIRYWHFILLHMTIIMVPLYYFKAYQFRVTLRATYKTFVMVLLVAPVIYNINKLLSRLDSTTSVNYWFISEIPENVEMIFSNHLIYVTVLLSLIYVSQMLLYKISNRNNHVINIEHNQNDSL
jgi:hypothetical integral membrane protein (TIGR02206 family)